MRGRKLAAQFGSVAVVLLFWQLSVDVFGLVSPSVLPAPTAIAVQTAALGVDAGFLAHVASTLRRTVIASVFAAGFGIVIGLAMGWNDTVRSLLGPIFSALYPLPVVALLPLLILIFGRGDGALIFAAAFGGFFLVAWNAMSGAGGIESVYFDVARDNDATSTYALFREVLLPGSLPVVFTGLRLGLSTSFLIVISVELIAANDGLGYFMWVSWNTYQLGELYASVVVIGAFGIAITYGLERLQGYLVPWEEETPRRRLI
ncbi:ABC transporter permease [Halalkaliarchaeum desulfuricum]|uniref:ABC transporter permease n=1 Tax=Halalkaliarchaeum desulfuricum TaxID=2055893 RepID=A0A343TI69_9EURY|nr:ABC transporter permease [Halalkaliarchaeum desulfuricum]AUX08791.1 ABC transporter permease [Halalkaliarchaeum desulfuricum]